MQRFAQRLVPVAAFLFASALSVSAHDHDAGCDMQNMDMSKMSSEDKQAMREKCAAQLRAENCGINGVDMSMMSTADQNAMKESCVDKMKQMGCDVKGIDLSKISAADTQKLMDQCHDKLVKSASKPTAAPVAAPAPKAG